MNIAAHAAAWLAHNTTAIARREDAADCYRDITNAIHDIEHLINRPIPDQFCGVCTIRYEGKSCQLALYAPRDATQVTCPRCKTTHNIAKLFEDALKDSDDMSFTLKELHEAILPAIREYIPLRTLQHWAATARIIPTGYDAAGDPRYLLADVRRLADTKPHTHTTGAAAHKRAS